MTGGDDVVGSGVVGHGGAYGGGAVGRGNAGGDAFAGLDGYGEGRGVPCVAGGHEGQMEFVGHIGRKGETHESAGVTGHEVHGVGVDAFGGHDEMAVAFTIVVVHDNDHAAVADVVHGLFDGAKRR